MQVKELMSRKPRAVHSHERLDAAARVLWERDCGFVPVVDAAGALVGVLTDRDLCMASYIQGRALGEIPVATAMARVVRTCRPEDHITMALQTMQQAQVHRLPVVDARGELVGVLSTNDVVRACHQRLVAIDGSAVVKLLAAISAPRATTAPARAPAAVANPAPIAPIAPIAPTARPAGEAPSATTAAAAGFQHGAHAMSPRNAPAAPATPAEPTRSAASPKGASSKPKAKGKGKKG